MRNACFFLTAGAAMLAACQPAPENGSEEQPSLENIAEVEGDTAATDVPAPEATPLADDNARWFIDATRAAYGPPQSEALLSFTCQESVLSAQRIVGQPLRGELVANMNFLGQDANTLVRVTNAESELGGSLWQGTVDEPAQMAKVIGTGDGAVTVDIDGENAILLRPSPEAARFVRACR